MTRSLTSKKTGQWLATMIGVAALLWLAVPAALACTLAPPGGTLAEVFARSRLVVLADVASLVSGDDAGTDVLAVREVFRGPGDTTSLRFAVPATRPLCWVPFFNVGDRVILALEDPTTPSAGSTALWRLLPDRTVEPSGTGSITGVPSSADAFIAELRTLGTAPVTSTDVPLTPPPSSSPGWLVLLCAGSLGALAFSIRGRFGRDA